MAEYLASIVKWVWRTHFRIQEAVYWAVLAVSAGGLPFAGGDGLLILGVAFGLSVFGIGRWHWHRAKARGGLAVPYLRASSGTPERAEEVQRDIQAAVTDHLPAELRIAVHRVPVVVGPEERKFASVLRRRLRARFLVYGRIADSPDGSWSVYPRVLEPSSGSRIIHIDPHTAELSSQRASWEDPSSKLPTSSHVTDEEYPHAFVGDLAAVLRATLGQLDVDREDSGRAARAEALLREALALAPTSTSRQMDRLRIDLASALAAQGKHAEGVEILRRRAEGSSPSPELLRAYSFALSPMGIRAAARNNKRSRRALEAALATEDDPLWWDLTLYNLINQLMADDGEVGAALGRLDELRTRFYRRRWYVLRLFGLRSWLNAEGRREAGLLDEMKPLASEAAEFYGRAIRRRWRLYPVLHRQWPFLAPPSRRPSPILYANIVDAHRNAGQHRRGRWNERRFQHLRKKLMKRAFRALDRLNTEGPNERELAIAFANLDWSIVGRPDEVEASALVWKWVIMRERGESGDAQRQWDHERVRNPFVYVARSYIWGQAQTMALVRSAGVPGDQPLDAHSAMMSFAQGYNGPALDGFMIPLPESVR